MSDDRYYQESGLYETKYITDRETGQQFKKESDGTVIDLETNKIQEKNSDGVYTNKY